MIQVKIGNEEHGWAEVDKAWIVNAITKRRAGGVPVSVQVRIKCDGVDLRFLIPAPTGGGGRPLSHAEREIVDAWNARNLNSPTFDPDSLIHFLKQAAAIAPCE